MRVALCTTMKEVVKGAIDASSLGREGKGVGGSKMMLVFFLSTEIVASEARTVLFNESNRFACELVLAIVGLTHQRSSLGVYPCAINTPLEK